jgi:N-acetylmuramoyl-L-alanine amidase
MRKITAIVIHCTASYGDVEGIKKYWKNVMKWKSVGYHRLVDLDGKAHALAPISEITNGVGGHNSDTIHISYIGGVNRKDVNKAEDTRTEDQKLAIIEAIFEVLGELKQHQDISKVDIKGHRDFPKVAKECPSFDAIKEYAWITKFLKK